MSSRENVLGYKVYRAGLQSCVSEILESLETSGPPRWLACLNPHSYVQAQGDSQFSRALKGADWLIPDGVGIVLASKWRRGAINERVTGSDIFETLLGGLNRAGGKSVFFLGSKSDTLEIIKRRMAAEFPRVRVAGMFSPPFKPEFSADDVDAMVRSVNEAKPDVLWVAMTAPKQEKWLHAHLPKLDVRFAAAIGAVFDFYSGRITRSNAIYQRLGLEWLPRLLQEPRRLWRRMGVSAPVFVLHTMTRSKEQQDE
jgi:N-acetylglucosaminyldiphosphoundecaprenol N-acetyl-beta-D-mannosaminyltransferase